VKRFLVAALALASIGPCGRTLASAQSMDDLNLQVHGYATQGFVYTTNNNWNTMNSTDGSSAWTEAVVNLTAQPAPKLRVGVQARYFLLGDYGNAISLDWAQGDYKFNERFGIRAGKVKTPGGLLNDSQDIDPAYLWVLLPQSIYALASRNSTLAHYGGVAYGTVSLGEPFGKMEYKAYGGQRVLQGDDGYFQTLRNQGLTLPNGVTASVFGGSLRWDTPVQGLTVGANEDSERPTGKIAAGPTQGEIDLGHFYVPYFFARYERNKVMFAGEYNRLALHPTIQFSGIPPIAIAVDKRSFYAMASYRLMAKLTGGLYYSSILDRKAAFNSARYQKDWAVAARYDFNPYLYLKLEQHFVDGMAVGFSASDNTALKPSTRMTLLKFGVSF
jgi:hypothetical protein